MVNDLSVARKGAVVAIWTLFLRSFQKTFEKSFFGTPFR